LRQSQNQNQKEQLQGETYKHFINAIRSPATRAAYETSIKRYLNHHKLKEFDDLLLHISNPRYIESQIIDYIMSLRQSGISQNTIKFLIAPILTFYQLNDVLLNRKKVFRYLGESKRVVKDQAYTIEQIQQALQTADTRMRMILLILTSTGCRIGSLPSLTLGNLTKIPDYDLYKITFYEGTNNEYYTFTTRECASTGIDNYLNYRQRCGERITFNENLNRWEPEDTPLIRLQFDINDTLQARHPKPITLDGLRIALYYHLIRGGLRQVEHLTETTNNNRIRKTIPIFNGFRKHVISTFIDAGLNHEIRELIVDHHTGLDANYFRPTEDQVLQEYMKAESLLTIDPAMRLREENRFLKVRADRLENVISEIEEVKKAIGL
jgi:site-specific recombinase XerD